MQKKRGKKIESKPITLVCLPYAGGSAYIYRNLSRHLPDFLRVSAPDLPGHGRRMESPLLTDIREMADFLYGEIFSGKEKPYAVFGHSMGGLLAYLICLRRFRANLSLPVHLFVSSCPAPMISTMDKNIGSLPDGAFLEKIRSYGGMPDEVLSEPELLELFLPILRADFKAVSEYEHEPAPLLPVPLTVMIGTRDHTRQEEAEKWSGVAKAGDLLRFTGNHFWFFDHLPELGKLIARKCEAIP